MRVVRLSLKGLGVALLMGVFWAIGWGAAGACFDCGVLGGVIVAAMSLVGLGFVYVWLTGTSQGRLVVVTERVGLRRGRMLSLASVGGLTYGIAAYLMTDSIALALLGGGAIELGEFVVVPTVLWRLLKRELDSDLSRRLPPAP